MAPVKLPCLTAFEIVDYTLFKSDVSWRFQDGINLLLGVNGVGKTTTIRALAFAIVGDLALNKKTTYFRSRVQERKPGVVPKVQVTFTVGMNEFNITRRLDTLEFMKFSVRTPNGSLETGASEEDYRQALLDTTGIPTLFELDFLLKHLLIREEEAEATLWNAEDHSRVLRLLFNSGDFERKYAKLQKAVKDCHVRYSQVANTLTYSQNALADFRAKWSREQSSSSISETSQLRAERERLTSELSSLQKDFEVLLTRVDKHRAEVDQAYSEKIDAEQQLEQIEERLGQLESAFHQGLYSQYTPLRMALRKLEQHRVCMFCDRTVEEPLREQLLSEYSTENECLFCHQHSEPFSGKIPTPPELDSSLVERRQARKTLDEADSRVRSLLKEMEPLNRLEGETRTGLLQARQRLGEVETSLATITGTSPDWYENEEVRLLASVDALRQQTDEARKALEGAQEEITPLRQVERETLRRLTEQFRSTFSNIVHQYLGEEGSVEVQIKANPGERSEYAVYTPILNGRPRAAANEVSKSQAVLLDYAFRMTVLQLYREMTGERSFFILETSEGVLDAAYVERIGRLLGDFALDSGHLLVLVNNLSRADFLEFVFHRVSVERRLPTTLNFLRFGRLSKVQQEGEATYNRVGNQVFGRAFSTL